MRHHFDSKSKEWENEKGHIQHQLNESKKRVEVLQMQKDDAVHHVQDLETKFSTKFKAQETDWRDQIAHLEHEKQDLKRVLLEKERQAQHQLAQARLELSQMQKLSDEREAQLIDMMYVTYIDNEFIFSRSQKERAEMSVQYLQQQVHDIQMDMEHELKQKTNEWEIVTVCKATTSLTIRKTQ